MAERRVHRRLAAILAADVVGYSRLVEADETGTIERLKILHIDVIRPMIAREGGRIVKTTGDGLLVEYVSAVDAVRNGLAIQSEMAKRNADLPKENRTVFRIGINLGDVIVDGDDIQGDGINVASRLEALCEPGRVYVSGTVREHVEGKIAVLFEDLGERTVKNIARPIRISSVRQAPENGLTSARSSVIPSVLDKPSIAILPFENLSRDPEQEYFSDGIAEELITALSRIRWFFVTARNSSFVYKGASTDIRRVADELGVRYVLEGSVRKSENRIRVTAQLIDGTTGNHVWAERYDRELADVFDLQDEITEKVVGALEPVLSKAEYQRSMAKRPDSLDAWDLCRQGWWHRYHNKREDFEHARHLFEQALDLDPVSVSALAGLCEVLAYQAIFTFVEDVDGTIERAVRLGRKAVEIDGDDPAAQLALGRALGVDEDFEGAIRALRKALDLNPYFAAAHYALGNVYIVVGRFAEGIDAVRKAIALSPQDSWMGGFYSRLAQAHLCMKDYEKAREWAEEALRCPFPPQWQGHSYLVSALGHLGRTEDAQRALTKLLEKMPGLTIGWIRVQRSNLSMGREFLDDYLDGLRKAGLSD